MTTNRLKEAVLISCLGLILTGISPLLANGNQIKLNTDPIMQMAQDITNENSLEGFGDEDSDDLEGFDDDSEEGDDLDGFGDDEDSDEISEISEDIDISKILAASDESSALTFGGFIKEDVAYGFAYEEPEWAKIKTTLNLAFDYKISEVWKSKLNFNGFYDYAYQRQGRDKFTDDTLDAYESEFEVRDFYIDGSFENQTYFKFGRQVIAWGQSNTNQINDMLNPRYQRELGMVDLEDARLPVVASKYTMVFNSFDFNMVAVHEIRGDKMATEGSEFDPFVSLRSMGIQIRDEELPESSFQNTEYAFRVSTVFNGGDIALIYSNTYEDAPYLDFYKVSISGAGAQLTVTPKHKRIWTVGLTGSMVSGSWLFKTEIAKKNNIAIGRKDFESQIAMLTAPGEYDEDSEAVKTWSEKDKIQGMLGIEYSGISDLNITFEGTLSKIDDYEDNLSSEETSGMYYLSFDYSALNETLKAKAIILHLTGNNGNVYRVNLDYDFIDALTGSIGMIYYETEDEEALLFPYRRNDKYFASIKYSF